MSRVTSATSDPGAAGRRETHVLRPDHEREVALGQRRRDGEHAPVPQHGRVRVARAPARRQHVARAEEPCDGRVGRPPQHVQRPSLLAHLAADEHVARVGERERLVAVVRDVQHRQAALAAGAPQQLLERLPRLLVHGAQRLVQQQGAGPGGERPRQRHPLALAARERGGAAVEQLLHAYRLGEPPDVRAPVPAVPGRAAQAVGDVLRHREVREQQSLLEHQTGVPALGDEPGDVGAGQPHLAGGRRTHTGDRLEHEALAGAARPEKHGVGAVLDRHVERPHAEAAGLHLESTQLDHGAPVFDRRRRGTRNVRSSRNTTNAMITMSTAGGCAARSPNPSNRSKVSTEMTLGL